MDVFVVLMKGQFKDEFVTAGGVPLSEVHSFFLFYSMSLSRISRKYDFIFSCLFKDPSEYNGKQNSTESILCRRGS